MKIEKITDYSFELDNHEEEVLKEAAKILSEISLQMNKRDCSIIISGYEDCPYEYTYDSLTNVSSMLIDVANAHTIC